MKKNRYIIIIVLALIAVSACAVLMIFKSGAGKDLTAANNSLKTQWSEYTKSVGENDAILKAALSEAKFSVKDIEEGTPSSTVTVEVDSKRLGEELKEYNENNAEPVKKDGANAVLLKLIDDAEETDKFEAWLNRKFGEKKAFNIIMYISVAIALVMSVGLFILLPTALMTLIKSLGLKNVFLLNLCEGVLRIAMFITYVLLISKMPDIKRDMIITNIRKLVPHLG